MLSDKKNACRFYAADGADTLLCFRFSRRTTACARIPVPSPVKPILGSCLNADANMFIAGCFRPHVGNIRRSLGLKDNRYIGVFNLVTSGIDVLDNLR